MASWPGELQSSGAVEHVQPCMKRRDKYTEEGGGASTASADCWWQQPVVFIKNGLGLGHYSELSIRGKHTQPRVNKSMTFGGDSKLQSMAALGYSLIRGLPVPGARDRQNSETCVMSRGAGWGRQVVDDVGVARQAKAERGPALPSTWTAWRWPEAAALQPWCMCPVHGIRYARATAPKTQLPSGFLDVLGTAASHKSSTTEKTSFLGLARPTSRAVPFLSLCLTRALLRPFGLFCVVSKRSTSAIWLRHFRKPWGRPSLLRRPPSSSLSPEEPRPPKTVETSRSRRRTSTPKHRGRASRPRPHPISNSSFHRETELPQTCRVIGTTTSWCVGAEPPDRKSVV